MRPARLVVVEPGALTTVQDRGRPGLAHLGVPPSGSFDRRAAALANRLVGNDPDAAVLETTLRGPVLLHEGDEVRWISLTGAPAPLLVGGRPAAVSEAVAVRPGERIEVGAAPIGLRSYLAVAGGVAVDPVLGSRSTDLLGGLGPPPVRTGTSLPLGRPGGRPGWADVAGAARVPDRAVLVLPGPRQDRLGPGGLAALVATAWVVGPSSDRVGVRLDGPPLPVRAAGLASEGTVTGAVQVPPDGRPVVLGPDHPVTGGYPVVAVVDDDDLPVLAQARPGGVVRFRLA